MADQEPNGGGNGADNGQPQVSILAQYVKDLSVENPSAPQVYSWQVQPQLDVQFNLNVEPAPAKARTKSTLKFDISARSDNGVHFVVDLSYAGLFALRNLPDEALPPFLMIEAPRLLFPFARQVISDAVSSTGFPPLMLDPIDFASAYMAQVEAAQQQAARRRAGANRSLTRAAGGNKPMNLARSLGSVGGLTLVSRILALVRDTLQASYVGANFASDAFFVAFRLPNMFRALVRRRRFLGGVHPDVQPQGRRSGRRQRRTALRRADVAILLPVLLLFTVLMIVAAWPITWRSVGRVQEPDARAVRLCRDAVADHNSLSDADQPRLAAGRHPQFARPFLGQCRGADPAQYRDDRRAVGFSTGTTRTRPRGPRRFRSPSAACCSSAG